MTLELYTELKKDIDLRLDMWDSILKSFPINEIGMAIERNEDYRAAKKSFNIVFNQLRTLNKNTSNKIKREYALNKRFK
tara:strand:+ start:405 stop:641 length:237 start_codon:yes stop_codon:yes gene_type:complete